MCRQRLSKRNAQREQLIIPGVGGSLSLSPNDGSSRSIYSRRKKRGSMNVFLFFFLFFLFCFVLHASDVVKWNVGRIAKHFSPPLLLLLPRARACGDIFAFCRQNTSNVDFARARARVRLRWTRMVVPLKKFLAISGHADNSRFAIRRSMSTRPFHPISRFQPCYDKVLSLPRK